MNQTDLLTGADNRLQGLIASLDPADLDKQSPCTDWNVRSLLTHTIASIDAFAAAVDGGSGPTEAELFSGADIVGTDPAGVARASIERSQLAWAAITEWDSPVTTVLGPIPAGQAIAIITYSTLIHSWDLAAATHRTVEFSSEEAALAEAVGRQVVPSTRPNGLFGPEVVVDADATPTQRVVAFAGRNPL